MAFKAEKRGNQKVIHLIGEGYVDENAMCGVPQNNAGDKFYEVTPNKGIMNRILRDPQLCPKCKALYQGGEHEVEVTVTLRFSKAVENTAEVANNVIHAIMMQNNIDLVSPDEEAVLTSVSVLCDGWVGTRKFE